MEWYEAVERVTPFVARITSPQGSGTGFLVTRAANNSLLGVATAAHVIDHAHYWEQPIRIQRADSQDAAVLRVGDRAILLDEQRDTAVILFNATKLAFPQEQLPMIKEGMSLKTGSAIGWLGYPAIGGPNLCFFNGSVSAWIQHMSAYFVDGVAINGVSGGPAFTSYGKQAEVIGVVSAYMPNRVTGETLPGLGIVRDVFQFHSLIKQLRSLDEAKEQQTPPPDTPPPIPPTDTPAASTSSRAS